MPNIRWIYRVALPVSIALLSGVVACWADAIHPSGTNAYQMVTGEDSEDDRQHWDTLFKTQTYVFGKEPAAFLRENIALLPVGRALDVAMSEGRNAVYLAKKGFKVDGVDISEVALRKAQRLARENRVTITTITADLNTYVVKPESYDVIVNVDFLHRGFLNQIKRGLKHGGYVVYENHTMDQLKYEPGTRKDFLLKKGELKELFREYQIVLYRETDDGKDARASIIARKP